MNNKILRLVGRDQSHNNNQLFIIAEKNIAYLDDNSNLVIVTENNFNSRALHYQEALNLLKYHNIKNVFSDSIYKIKDGGLFTKKDSSNDDDAAIFPSIDNVSSQDLQDFEENLDKILIQNKEKMEIFFYDSSIKNIDLSNFNLTVDLIKYDSDTYVNSLDLNNLIKYSSIPGTSCMLDINIQYSTIDSKVFNKSIILEGFKFTEEGRSNVDIIQDLEDVTVSYINGILEVTPNTIDIIEVIINKCTATYGKL